MSDLRFLYNACQEYCVVGCDVHSALKMKAAGCSETWHNLNTHNHENFKSRWKFLVCLLKLNVPTGRLGVKCPGDCLSLTLSQSDIQASWAVSGQIFSHYKKMLVKIFE
jgi:hypothetical protein